jgi:lysophospholipase L1-like esterase
MPALAQIKVACIGNSITAGSGYTTLLQNLLGQNYKVSNFGHSGATMLREGSEPYWQTTKFNDALGSTPDIAIIMLGTNDSKPGNWSKHSTNFLKDYLAFIDTLQSLPSNPLIVVCRTPPAYPGACCYIDPTTIEQQIVPLVDSLCKLRDVIKVNIFSALSNHASLFPDGVHPNSAGAQIIADTIAAAIANIRISHLSMSPKSIALDGSHQKQQVQLSATVSGISVQQLVKVVQWSSSDPTVASVDGGGVVSAHSGGTARVYAKFGLTYDSVAVTVSTSEPNELSIVPYDAIIAKNAPLQLKGLVLNQYGTTIDTLSQLAWQNRSYGSIDSNGHYKADSTRAYVDTIMATYTQQTRIFRDTAVIVVTDKLYTIKINFQPQGVSIPQGYLPDYGQPFGPKDSTLSYGWQRPNFTGTRQRSGVQDLRLSTINHMQREGNNGWEIALPNGDYFVTLGVGDEFHDSFHQIMVEDSIAVSFKPDSATHYQIKTILVAVLYGRLTIHPGPNASNSKICFIDIAGPLSNSNGEIAMQRSAHAQVNPHQRSIQKRFLGIGRAQVQPSPYAGQYLVVLLNGRRVMSADASPQPEQRMGTNIVVQVKSSSENKLLSNHQK